MENFLLIYQIHCSKQGQKGWLDTSDRDSITVTTNGDNVVEYDLPKEKKLISTASSNLIYNNLLFNIPNTLRNELIEAYQKIENRYIEHNWEPSELNGGKIL